ncbi:MAG: 3-isopropylmalate dehydratase small subunit [Clostridia bacterium]|nr:3-isopropylmalate dehydratase small subunit [Clostridia bacterium]MBQ7788788.1 3-isopropylmalate dehydratase small subunit [Clostridia bacterium]
MNFTGKVLKYGDNVDTDVIIPARYLNTSDHKELASHCMEDIDKDFTKKVEEGDIMVAGFNFGCGSSREHAPIAIKASGISLVIAKSFARIFYRNSINIGLAILECDEAVDNINDGDKVEADLDNGIIYNRTTGKSFKTQPFPEFIQKIITNGGLIETIKKGELK